MISTAQAPAAAAQAPPQKVKAGSAPVGILTVTVIQGADMPKMDTFGDNDTYVKLAVDLPVRDAEHQLKEAAAQAKAAGKSQAGGSSEADGLMHSTVCFAKTQVADLKIPIWHETFPFPCMANPPRTLHVEAWDKDRSSSDDFIGRAIVDLAGVLGEAGGEGSGGGKLAHQKARTLWVDLTDDKGKPAGRVELLMHYLPKSGMERLSHKFSHKSEMLKSALTNKVVAYVADMAAGTVKSSFGIKS